MIHKLDSITQETTKFRRIVLDIIQIPKARTRKAKIYCVYTLHIHVF